MTRRSYSLNSLLVLLPLLLGACAAAPHEVPSDLPVWRSNVSYAEANRVGWPSKSQAFGVDFEWRVGDRVLYALTRYNQGDVQKRLIEIRVEEQTDSASGMHFVFGYLDDDGEEKNIATTGMNVRVIISDEQGREISSSPSIVPKGHLRLGFLRGCKASSNIVALKTKEDSYRLQAPRELYEAVASLNSLFGVISESASLRPILEEVVEKPPLLTLLPALFGGRISIGISPDFAASRKVAIPDFAIPEGAVAERAGLEAYSFPMTSSINDYPGLYTRILAAPPELVAPLGAGIIAVEGRHPSNKDIWLSLHLIGSLRGPPVLQK